MDGSELSQDEIQLLALINLAYLCHRILFVVSVVQALAAAVNRAVNGADNWWLRAWLEERVAGTVMMAMAAQVVLFLQAHLHKNLYFREARLDRLFHGDPYRKVPVMETELFDLYIQRNQGGYEFVDYCHGTVWCTSHLARLVEVMFKVQELRPEAALAIHRPCMI